MLTNARWAESRRPSSASTASRTERSTARCAASNSGLTRDTWPTLCSTSSVVLPLCSWAMAAGSVSLAIRAVSASCTDRCRCRIASLSAYSRRSSSSARPRQAACQAATATATVATTPIQTTRARAVEGDNDTATAVHAARSTGGNSHIGVEAGPDPPGDEPARTIGILKALRSWIGRHTWRIWAPGEGRPNEIDDRGVTLTNCLAAVHSQAAFRTHGPGPRAPVPSCGRRHHDSKRRRVVIAPTRCATASIARSEWLCGLNAYNT